MFRPSVWAAFCVLRKYQSRPTETCFARVDTKVETRSRVFPRKSSSEKNIVLEKNHGGQHLYIAAEYSRENLLQKKKMSWKKNMVDNIYIR